jgi:FKBP-type peptidyl-prolyl cis-trans isomerase
MKKLLLISTLQFLYVLSGSAQRQALPTLEEYLSQNNIVVKTGEEGLRYLQHDSGNGISPKEGDYVLIRYKAMLLDSTVFDQSEARDPFVFRVGNREVIKGLDKGIRILHGGGRATFYIPPSLGYMQYGVGEVVPPDAALIYEVELVDVMNFDQYDAYMRDLEERERREYESEQKTQFQQDLRLIEEYAVANKLKTRRIASGLSYFVVNPGKGDYAKPGNRLKVHYEGYLTDGTLFEKSTEPFEFTLGSRKVIEGWEEGLQFFNKGAEGWLLVPSKLGYGRMTLNVDGASIPSNSVLIFKIKVLEVGK